MNTIVTGLVIAILLVILRYPVRVRGKGGRLLGFFALMVAPVVMSLNSTSLHIENTKTTKFCLSCHVMEPYGESLKYKDPDFIPAGHFQNQRVPRDKACFTCHTSYTMYGDIHSKIRGLKHVYAYYFTDMTKKRIKLYEPYNNRECLHCHEGSRSYLEASTHEGEFEAYRTNQSSCLECHEMKHSIDELSKTEKWEGAKAP